jgi:hypothetical protein
MADAGYWSVSYDPGYLRGWWLGDIRDSDGYRIDDRVFLRGERLSRSDGLTLPLYPFGEQQQRVRLPLRAVVERPGRQTDLSLAGVGAPVVSAQLGRVFQDYADDDVELLPLAIEEADPAHFVLNVARLVDAIDGERSAINYWPADAPASLAGKPSHVSKLVVRGDTVLGIGCFRPSGWGVALIVSSDLMRAIRALDAPEIEFEPV